MTEHKFTDDEVIRALECCVKEQCENCCNIGNWHEQWNCMRDIMNNALDLINRHKTNLQEVITLNSKLEAETVALKVSKVAEVNFAYKVTKEKAIKEFAKGLKEKLYGFPTVYNSAFNRMIDNLVKEMTEEKT